MSFNFSIFGLLILNTLFGFSYEQQDTIQDYFRGYETKADISINRAKDYESQVIALHAILNKIRKYKIDYTEHNSLLNEIENNLNLKLLQQVHGSFTKLDSVIFYQQKIIESTDSKVITGRAYGMTAWSYANASMYLDAVVNYLKAIEVYRSSEDDNVRIFQCDALFNLSKSLLFLDSTEFAEVMLDQIRDILPTFENHPNFLFYAEKLKLSYVFIEIHNENFLNANQIIASIDYDFISDFKLLLHEYYFAQHLIYRGLDDTAKGEMYLDCAFDRNIIGNLFINNYKKRYANQKLQYSILNNNIDEANDWFGVFTNLIHENEADYEQAGYFKTISEFYKLAGDTEKSLYYLEMAIEKDNKVSKSRAANRLQINKYLLDYSNEISNLKLANENKDLKISETQKQKLLIVITSVLLFIIFALIFFYLYRVNRIKYKIKLKLTQESLKTKQVFLENFAHEIRTPISVISGYMYLIKQHVLEPKKIISYTENTLNNSERILQNLNESLMVMQEKQPQSNQFEVHEVLFKSYFEQIINSFAVYAQLNQISFFTKTNIQAEACIKLPKTAIESILNNLLSNALKHSPSKSKIFVTFMADEQNLFIKVKDQGIGIPKAEQSKVFDRFYQSPNNEKSGGFGIGLSLVKYLVEGINGHVTITSGHHKGACFEVRLPIQIPGSLLHLTSNCTFVPFKVNDGEHEDEEIKNNHLPNILVVDDNYNMLTYLSDLLKDYYTCYTAKNGIEALEIVQKINIKLVITDLRMPLMDGFNFKRELDKMENFQNLPFIVLSAVYVENKSSLIEKFGLTDYLYKPFIPNELLKRVHSLIEKQVSREIFSKNNTEQFHLDSEVVALLDKLHKQIKKELSNSNYSIKQLAADVGYSQRRLNTILKNFTGMNTSALVLEIKLLSAYDSIVTSKYSTLNEVVYSIGLSSRAYFNRCFEERFGIKPGELMKKHKQST